MAERKFKEFRQYFDKRPQYIQANPMCYTLIPNIDLLEDECISQPIVDRIDSKSMGDESEGLSSLDSIREPFSGDLQLIHTDKDSPQVTRKRRKLPEIPKNLHNQWNRDSKEVSLAQELSDADFDNGSGGKLFSEIPGNSFNRYLNCKSDQTISTFTTLNRPIFLLKFSSSVGGRCYDISPESDQSSLDSDSGNSTIHSDGSKLYSPQITSINESLSPSGVPLTHLEMLEATHRGLNKFIPRHRDEMMLDIGDPIYIQNESDDLWCEGVNLRTGKAGIFPSAYVVDVEYNDFDPSANKVKKERYFSNYIGSIESLYHKGNQVLCEAVKKITRQENYVTSNKLPCILEISDNGIRMLLGRGKVLVKHVSCHDYFYSLENISWISSTSDYFGFVTKHPTLNRFACHVFISDASTAQAVERAFQRFYQKFIETAYAIEDIYLE